MQNRRLLLLVAVIATAFLGGACSLFGVDDGTERSPEFPFVDFSRFEQDSTLLVGTWTWVRTTCCYGKMEVSTPESTGETHSVVITEDDTVEVYRNDELEERAALDAYLDGAQWGVKNDSLAVSWAYIDGPEDLYVREE